MGFFRYTKLADWDYVERCAALAGPAAFFGEALPCTACLVVVQLTFPRSLCVCKATVTFTRMRTPLHTVMP